MTKKKTQGRNTQVGEKNIIEHDERMVPEFHKGNEIYGEHIARYRAAESIVDGKVVLDVASGSGYGTKIMSAHAKKIYGVDVSKEAIRYSEEHYSAPNIEYLIGDGEKLPLNDKSVQVVTSFETIEHIKDYLKFLKEVKRVLAEDGIFVVSTPNDLEFTEGNHFHLHQFEEQELLSLLKKDYRYVECFYQSTWLFNAIGDIDVHSKEWEQSINVLQTTKVPNKKILYFYFVCSNRPIKAKERISSLGTIGEHWSEKEIRTKTSLTDKHIKNLEEIAADRLNYIRKLEGDITILREQLALKMQSKGREIIRKVKPNRSDT